MRERPRSVAQRAAPGRVGRRLIGIMPERPPDPARDLRIAIHAADGSAILGALAAASAAGLLQTLGDGVLMAIDHGYPPVLRPRA